MTDELFELDAFNRSQSNLKFKGEPGFVEVINLERLDVIEIGTQASCIALCKME